MPDFDAPYDQLVFACELEDRSMISDIISRHPGLIDFSSPGKPRATSFCHQQGHMVALEALLDLGAVPSMLELSKPCLSSIKLLLAHGANPNEGDETGWTVLHTACSFGWEEVAYLLLENGADLNCKDRDGWSPMDVCEEGSYPSLLSRLVSFSEALKLSASPPAVFSHRSPRRV